MSPPSHIIIAANPKSGASSRAVLVAELKSRLAERGFSVTVCQQLEQVRELSHQLWQAGQLYCVVAAGGDGTAAAVVNLIPTSTRLAIFPLGTENLLARYLELTSDPERSAAMIQAGKTRGLDAGLADGRLFLVMLGCGFDTEVVSQMHQLRRGHINRWSYAKPIWRAMRSYQYPPVEVQWMDSDSQPEGLQPSGSQPNGSQPSGLQPSGLQSGDAKAGASSSFTSAWVFAFNLPRYAASLDFCPQASGNDGWLDVCAFKQGGMWTGLSYLWQLWRGKHQRLKDFRHVRARKFRLTSPGRVPYQIDGDPGGYLPLEIEVLPDRLTLIVP